MELKGKVAIVTGGNGGLGRRISFALAKNGVDVAIIFKESEQEAKSVSDEVRSFGVNSFPFQCDISKSEDVKSMLKAVENKFHRLDILINNAAYNKWIPFSNLEDMTEDEWNKMLQINLTGHLIPFSFDDLINKSPTFSPKYFLLLIIEIFPPIILSIFINQLSDN